MEEFSEKGFQGASLRQIVKQAGVTTGAFYGYFSSKEALFASIVEPHAAALMGRFMEAQTTFAEMPEKEQPEHMGLESSQCVHWMVDYILSLIHISGQAEQHFKLERCAAHWDRPQRFLLRLRQGKPADLHPRHTVAPAARAGALPQ